MSYVKGPDGVVINNDISHYNSILALRNSQKNQQALETELVDVKSELERINKLLEQVINRN